VTIPTLRWLWRHHRRPADGPTTACRRRFVPDTQVLPWKVYSFQSSQIKFGMIHVVSIQKTIRLQLGLNRLLLSVSSFGSRTYTGTASCHLGFLARFARATPPKPSSKAVSAARRPGSTSIRLSAATVPCHQ
jgi:hypothetical protein